MGQAEVFDWLKARRKETERYYSIVEINLGVNGGKKNSSVYDDIIKWWGFGALESRTRGSKFSSTQYVRVFRLKKEYCE